MNPTDLQLMQATLATKDAEIKRLREALEYARGAVNDNDGFTDVAEVIDAALEVIPDPSGGMPVEVK